MKVGFIASTGGHWEELMCLLEVADGNDTFFVTEEGLQANDFDHKPLYVVPMINRHEKMFIFHFISLYKKARKIIKKEKPDVVISTGALIAYPFCLAAKRRGAKVIYIESFARIDNASLTGKFVYRFADLFLVQWESLLKVYPKAIYVGGIF